MNRFKDWAHWYANMLGPVVPLCGVLPDGSCACGTPLCPSAGKHPNGDLAPNGVKNATRDPAVIEAWWTKYPMGNIGVAMGDGLVCLDRDPRNGGDKSYDELIAETAPLPDTLTEKTGGGGMHYFFHDAERSVRSRKGFLPGLDLIADGGYAVVAPSLHASGQPYVQQGDGTQRPALLPATLRDVLKRSKVSPPAKSLSSIPMGDRNTTLYRIGCSMRSMGLDDGGISAALKTINITYCAPPLPTVEVEAIVRSVMRQAKGPVKSMGPIPESSFVTATQVASMTPAQVHWIAKPYVAKGAVTELMGKPKIGKSTILKQLIESVIFGKLFLGQATVKTKVLLLTEERLTPLRDSLGRGGLLAAGDRLFILMRSDCYGYGWAEIIARAVELCGKHGIEVLVVDTLSEWALAGTDENNAGAMLDATRPLSEAAAAGLSVVTLRHSRKSGGDVASAGRGSSAITGAVDITLHLRDEPWLPTNQRLLDGISRLTEMPGELVVDWSNNRYTAIGPRSQARQGNLDTELLKIVPVDAGIAKTSEDLIAELESVVGTVSRKKVDRGLVRLCNRNLVVRVGSGNKGDPYRYHQALPTAVQGGRA